VIQKAAQLSAHELTDAELAAINKHTLEPLKAEDVFTFKAVLCDNEIDRQFERFSLKALQDLQKLFLGKTVIKNHRWNMEGQVARIYATELVQSTKTIKAGGELYTQLLAKIYMVKTASNADLIAEIKAGIKKEGSVGCAVSSAVCSICGADNSKTYCPHWPGKSYDKEGGAQVCTFLLDGARDAYEFSLVAVPAQKAAGVSKSYTGKTVSEEEEPKAAPEVPAPQDPQPANDADKEREKALALRARLSAAKTKQTKTTD
jgi:hypothetical protein